MTLVQAINAATIVSVGVGPMFVPSRSLGSSMTALTSRTEISVREWVGQLPRIRCVTVVFSFTVTMTLLLLYQRADRDRTWTTFHTKGSLPDRSAARSASGASH